MAARRRSCRARWAPSHRRLKSSNIWCEAAMSSMKSPSRAMLRDNAPVAALVALYVLIEIAQPGFLALSTQLGLLADSSTLFIMAAGTTFVVLLGSIDLSLQAVASLASVVVALCLPRYGAWAG